MMERGLVDYFFDFAMILANLAFSTPICPLIARRLRICAPVRPPVPEPVVDLPLAATFVVVADFAVLLVFVFALFGLGIT